MSDDTAPSLNELGRLADNIRFILDAKACANRIDELAGMTTQAIEAKVVADQAHASLAARVAELDRREEKIRAAEVELHTRKQQVEGRHRELSAHARHLGEIEDQIKSRVLRHAGALQHYNPAIQRLPEWTAIDRELGMGTGDAHFDGNDQLARDAPALGAEAPENLVVGSTLTRSRPPRPTRADMVRGA